MEGNRDGIQGLDWPRAEAVYGAAHMVVINYAVRQADRHMTSRGWMPGRCSHNT